MPSLASGPPTRWSAARRRTARGGSAVAWSGRAGRFEAIRTSRTYMRFSNESAVWTHCGDRVVPADEINADATGWAMYLEGDYVEPIDAAERALRRPGHILMTHPLPDAGGGWLTVQPFDGGVMWTMPAREVRKVQPRDPSRV